jgi:hypothetical protein
MNIDQYSRLGNNGYFRERLSKSGVMDEVWFLFSEYDSIIMG